MSNECNFQNGYCFLEWNLSYGRIPQLSGLWGRRKVRGEGFNNTWNEVVVAAGLLIIVPSWLQLTGSSVLCLEEVVKGSQTSCTQQVCLTHLQLGQSECVRVCVALEGKVNPFLCKQSHHTGQNTFQPPPPPPPVCKVVWCGNSRGWGFGSNPDGASESRWRKTCSTLIWLHITHVTRTHDSPQA